MKTIRGLWLVVALVLMLQGYALARQPVDKLSAISQRDKARQTATLDRPEMERQLTGPFDWLMAPFRWITGGEKK